MCGKQITDLRMEFFQQWLSSSHNLWWKTKCLFKRLSLLDRGYLQPLQSYHEILDYFFDWHSPCLLSVQIDGQSLVFLQICHTLSIDYALSVLTLSLPFQNTSWSFAETNYICSLSYQCLLNQLRVYLFRLASRLDQTAKEAISAINFLLCSKIESTPQSVLLSFSFGLNAL